jgi:hypothetical protein
MERNDRIHPSDPRSDETSDDPIFPDDAKRDDVEDPEVALGRVDPDRVRRELGR